MTDQLISFETAKLAREKGFACITNLKYTLSGHMRDRRVKGYDAPTQSLLQRWLREKHNILVFVTYRSFACIPARNDGYYYHIGVNLRTYSPDRYVTYEEALEQGLIEALKLIP